MAIHRDLTGDELHEPKGIENAVADMVYVSDGAGSGVWNWINLTARSATQLTNSGVFSLDTTYAAMPLGITNYFGSEGRVAVDGSTITALGDATFIVTIEGVVTAAPSNFEVGVSKGGEDVSDSVRVTAEQFCYTKIIEVVEGDTVEIMGKSDVQSDLTLHRLSIILKEV